MVCELTMQHVLVLLAVGALLGSAPGAMVANLLTAALRKKLGLKPREARQANETASDSVDQDDQS
jgi:hypothetical protein